MCLYVEYDDSTLLEHGHRRARKEHRCTECRRTIEPGERYEFWTSVGGDADGIDTQKMCAHCGYTLDLGVSFTGCPRIWWWGSIHDLNGEDGGFVGDILYDEGHDLTTVQQRRMLGTVIGRRRGWRGPDGALLPLPLDIEGPAPDPACEDCEGSGRAYMRPCDCVAARLEQAVTA